MGADPVSGDEVLAVDDDEHLLALIRLALQKHGLRVTTCTTAAAAADLVAATTPDLVVLDVVLPDMSGWEFLRRLRTGDGGADGNGAANGRHLPVLLLSGRDSDVDKARGLDLGADDYLTKPFSFLEFEARVRALLRRSRGTGR